MAGEADVKQHMVHFNLLCVFFLLLLLEKF